MRRIAHKALDIRESIGYTQNQRAIGRLGELNLSADQELEPFYDRSDEIGMIAQTTHIKTIEDIAFQTNILDLKAAVEAARAGTAGKGFSVVAAEVRSLAAKSAEAAQNTNDLISRSIQSAQTGTESTDMAVSAMRVINNCIQSIKALMDEIAAAHGAGEGYCGRCPEQGIFLTLKNKFPKKQISQLIYACNYGIVLQIICACLQKVSNCMEVKIGKQGLRKNTQFHARNRSLRCAGVGPCAPLL